MIELVAIDPGLLKTGIAVWTGKSEKDLSLAIDISPPRRGDWTIRGRHIAERIREIVGSNVKQLVIEMPEYQSGRMESEAATRSGLIMHLAGLVGMIIFVVNPKNVRVISPADWKGQVPKKLAHKWLKEHMERNAIPFLEMWPHLGPDTKDAIAIGLKHIGDLNEQAKDQG